MITFLSIEEVVAAHYFMMKRMNDMGTNEQLIS